jgi:Xaa-Pro aminopeptidase
MVRDALIRSGLEKTNWDLLACSMPSNVLLLTGYWPAAGYSMAVATREGRILLIVPEDEDEFAEYSWADDVRTYCPAPLDRLLTAEEPVFEAFADLKADVGMIADRIGFEQAEAFEPPAYAPYLFRGSAARILRRAFPSATLAPADELLAELRAIKTPAELEHIRIACRITEEAFRRGADLMKPGFTEIEIAACFRAALSHCMTGFPGVRRCDGFVYCMSGPNAARGWGPYSRSRNRIVRNEDFVIVRCHSYADGYWVDVSRTYHIGPLQSSERQMLEAVTAAHEAAIGAIRPGIRGGDLDRVARIPIESYGFGALIRHAAGHGAGFGTLDHTARPRLHPKSDDVLEPGMVVKLELGVYSDDAGVRKSDIVAVTDSGANALTRFHCSFSELALGT